MNLLTLLILVLVVAAVVFAAFVGVQHKRRAGGVIAAKPPKGRSRS